jgi:hypothetical protein
VLKWGHQEEHGIQPAARCAVCGTNTPTGVAVFLHHNPAGPGAILVCSSPACRAAAQRTAALVIPLAQEAS